MRNEAQWRPTKFVVRGEVLRASEDAGGVATASLFIADVLAPRYHDLLRRHASGRLLDLGAGAVPLYGAYRSLVDEVTCLDWGESAHDDDHIDIKADLNQPLPVETGRFDTVVLTDVLEHVYQPHRLMAEIARILAPRGKLLLAVPFLYWIHEAPNDYARYTSFMLRRLCEDNELSVLCLEPTGGSPEVLLDLIGKHLAWSRTLARAHQRAASWCLRLPGVAAFSAYSARWFPQGHVLVAQKGNW